jgi:hypothetical protein
MTTESYQRLPCILCMLHGVEGSVGAFGPYNLYCRKHWGTGDPRYTAECFGDERPPNATLN